MTVNDRDEITLTDQERPSEPPVYTIEGDPDAPQYIKELSRQQAQAQLDYRAHLTRIERNQETNYRETRRLSKRVNDHENELEEVRDRVDRLESRLDEHERDAE